VEKNSIEVIYSIDIGKVKGVRLVFGLNKRKRHQTQLLILSHRMLQCPLRFQDFEGLDQTIFLGIELDGD
jgi:hypothetical protein